MAPTYKLHAPPGSFRAFKALIAAEYAGIEVSVADPYEPESVKKLSPSGRGIVLETSKGVIFESNAIARYLSRIRRDVGLMGGGSAVDEALVDSWIDWCANELELPATIWFYPVAGQMPFHEKAYNKAKSDLTCALSSLNAYLADKTYLVGDSVTLADIVVASALVYPMKLVCDKAYLKPHGNVVRWFQTCVNQPEFKAVIGTVALCKKEMTAPGQQTKASAAGASNQKGGKKDKKAEKSKKKTEDAPPPPPKKTEHPYKVMDKKSPSKFSMDAWKKTYSNCKTYDEAMNTFWETFDQEGWSLWYQTYNYNEDNKRIFMTCNAVGGFQQRTDEIRKWAFGVMDVLGTEETKLEIRGIWLLRGDTVDHIKNANDDANWYSWTKLAGPNMDPTDDVKEKVKAYWCSENELEGMPIQDSKVFK